MVLTINLQDLNLKLNLQPKEVISKMARSTTSIAWTNHFKTECYFQLTKMSAYMCLQSFQIQKWKHNYLRINQPQFLRKPRSSIWTEGHWYPWCPLPPQLVQMTMDTQSRLIWPGRPQLRQIMSRNGPPTISRGSGSDLGHWRATWPDILQILQTGSLGQSRARWPVFRQLLQAFSLVQSTAMWPGL